MRYTSFPSSFFFRNRERLSKKLPRGSCAIIFSNEVHSYNADSEALFKQNSNFFYLTGIEKPGCSVVIFSEDESQKNNSLLFIPKVGEHEKIWEGDLLTEDLASKISGVSKILHSESFMHSINGISLNIDTFFLDLNEHSRKPQTMYKSVIEQKVNHFKSKFPLHNFDRLGPILSKMRAIKSEEEIKAIERACKITGCAFRSVLKKIKKCKYEYELEAEIVSEALKNGCYRLAYNPIIASGKNALALHYGANHDAYNNEDMILMDIGAEYGNYSSDTTRVAPASGKFSLEASKIYDSVLDILKLSDRYFKLGKSLQEAFGGMLEELKEKILSLGLIKETKSNEYNTFFMHGMGHHLGLDTHDSVDSSMKIAEGMVFAIEPAIYVAKKNIGIRLENNFYMKGGELINMCREMPIEREEIEDIVNE